MAFYTLLNIYIKERGEYLNIIVSKDRLIILLQTSECMVSVAFYFMCIQEIKCKNKEYYT